MNICAWWTVSAMVLAVGPSVVAEEGTLDPGFGVGGIVRYPACCEFRRVAVQPDLKLVAVGYSLGGNMLVARYDENGTPDGLFGSGGLAAPAPGRAFALALQADGKIVVVGRFSGSVLVARLTTFGGLDADFGSGGVAEALVCATAGAVPSAVAVQPSDGKIVVAGYCSEPGGFILRFNANGTPDTAFGMGGQLVITSHPNGSVRAFRGLALDSLERIVVAGDGEAPPGDGKFLAMRFGADGTLDATFGAGGAAFVNVVPDSDEWCFDMTLSSSDQAVMAGSYKPSPGSPDHVALVRLTSAGAADPTFGTAGVVTTTLGNYERAWSALIQPDGRIVAVGLAGIDGNPSTNDFLVARYSPSGVPDASFGTNGVVRTDIGAAGAQDEALGVAVQGSGRIVVAGSSFGEPVLARYSATTPVQLQQMTVE